MAVINTNMASLNAQRNLMSSQTALATSLQRLSSGLRINSAKDDAAGLAISERFSTQIRGLNQAARNANDGISLAQTAEGAMGEVSSNLQRIRELAVQSANATNSDSDRIALDSEVQLRVAELNRIASQTEFNGTSLLNGTFTAKDFQVGANQGQTITVSSIGSATAAALGLNGGSLNRYQTTGTAVTGALSAGDLTLNGADIGAVSGDAKAIATAINNTDSRFAATAANAQTAINFASIVGAAGTPATASTVTLGAFTTAVSNGTAASITPATATTISAGAFTTAVSSGSAAVAREETFGVFTPAVSGAVAVTTASTASSGAFSGVTLGAAETYSLSLTTNGNTVNLFTQTNGVVANNGAAFTMNIDGISFYSELGSVGGSVTKAELDSALTAFLAANSGYQQVSGSFATDNLRLRKLDGTDIVANITSNFSGTPGAFAANTNNIAGSAAVAPTGGAFTIQVDGNTFYTEAAATSGTVTAAELDTGLNTYLAGAGAGLYTKTGTFAGNNLVLSRLDGQDSTIAISSNFSGTGSTAGALAGTLTSTNGTPAAIVSAIAPTDTAFTLNVDGLTIYNEAASIGGTVTSSELDTALGTFLTANTGYTKTGTFAGGNLVLSKTDGTASAVTITSNFSSTAGAFASNVGVTGTQAVTAPASYSLTLDGNAVDLNSASANGTITGAEMASAIGNVSGFSASFNAGTSKLSITKADGSNFTLVQGGADAGVVAGSEGLTATAVGSSTYRGTVSLNSSIATTIGGNAPSKAGMTAGATTASSLAYGATNVLSAVSANTLLEVVDNALTTVNNSRANLGSIQNRFDSVINSLTTTNENLTAARSRILDTDFAAETANLTRNQILQQAGTAMLAQANALPQSVLALLK